MKNEQQWHRTLNSLSNMQLAAGRKSNELFRRCEEIAEQLKPNLPTVIFDALLLEHAKILEKHNDTWHLYLSLGEMVQAAANSPFSYTWTRSDGTTCEGVWEPNKEHVA